jgi:MYXO-CTERM domain-containing protein
MSRISIAAASSVLVALVAYAVPVSAELVSFDFVVQLTSVEDSQNVMQGALAVGDEVTGQFTLDTSSPDLSGLPTLGFYREPLVSLTGDVGGVPIAGPGPEISETYVRIPTSGPYGFEVFEDPTFLGTRADFRFWLGDSTRSWTEGDVLPTEPFPYFDFSLFQLAAQAPGGFVRLEGVVTSFTPEPATVTLVGLGALALLGRVRRRHNAPTLRSHRKTGRAAPFLICALLAVIGASGAAFADAPCGCTDIVFVVDTTASMSNALTVLADSNGLRAVIDMAEEMSGGDLRVGLITFDGAQSTGADYLRVHSSLTDSVHHVRDLMALLEGYTEHGGHSREASDEAFREMLRTTP